MTMTQKAKDARNQRLSAALRIVETHSDPTQPAQPKTPRRAKRRYMVEPMDVTVRVATV